MVTTLPLGPFLLCLVDHVSLTIPQNASCVERFYSSVSLIKVSEHS